MRRLWLVILLVGCRQVFGIDEPFLGNGGLPDARTDGHAVGNDGPAVPVAGLAMYVEGGVALWMNDQPPDVAWAQTNPALAKTDVWTGQGPSFEQLVFNGELDPQQQAFSVWMEGQINLAQGQQTIQMTASDYAFFDVELAPNGGAFQEVVSSRNDMMQMRSFSVQAAGWYRVRIGWASATTTADFSVLHSGGNMPSTVAFDVTNLRH